MGPYTNSETNNKCYYLGIDNIPGQYTVMMRRPGFPGSLTDLHRFRKTAHGHDGSSRIVMVRKTDQRTFASIQNGQEPKLETITRETIETFRGERTECKVTTEKKGFEEKCPQDILEALVVKAHLKTAKRTSLKRKNSRMEFQNECLKAHNEYRKKHGVPPLKLNKDISKFSQQWADNLIKKGILQHSNDKDYGENLFCIQSSNTNFTVSGREAVDSWYDEIKVHTFGIEPKSLASGHFTQVIWKDSKELGVAFARSGGKVVVVANYYPPGNIIGHFDENVPPIGGSASSKTENNNHIPLTSGFSKLSLFKGSSKDLVKATEGNFEQDFLDAHNKYRRRHGTPPLELDKQLSKYATEWAKHLATKNILEHRPGSNYGENIYCIYSSDPTFVVNGNSPVDTWYEEIKDHPFGREPSNLKSGHFTQVVWKDSKQLGVGVAKNAQGNIYVVANYSPAGNFVKHYVENVPPVKPNFYDDEVLTNIMKKEKQEASSSTEAQSKTEDKSSTENKEAFTQFVIDAWKVHNEYRRKHGVPELSLSEKLCNFAQDWAETCAKTASLQHRANNPYGENIFSVYSSDYSHVPTARDAVKEWYDEIKLHTFGVEKVNQKSLHFTQVVWKNSTHLGIGMAQNKKGQTYVVANYEPRGNYIGQFVENVPKPKP